jgi:CRISPR-associated endoribonuclease Cas6
VPSRWSLLFEIPAPDAVRPDWVAAMVSTWIETDAEHHAPRKPFTISPFRPLPGRPRRQVALDIGILDDRIVPRLLAGAQDVATRGGELGPQPATVLPWEDGRLGRVERAQEWADLARAAPVGRRVRLALLSPVTFRSGKRYRPFPQPGLVFGHLREQWTQWDVTGRLTSDGTPAAEPNFDDCDLSVEDCRLDRVAVDLRGRPAVGNVGEVTYRVGSRDLAVRAAIGRWLAVLPYAALGSETRMGLGQAEVLDA